MLAFVPIVWPAMVIDETVEKAVPYYLRAIPGFWRIDRAKFAISGKQEKVMRLLHEALVPAPDALLFVKSFAPVQAEIVPLSARP